jgi:hypothetical protein
VSVYRLEYVAALTLLARACAILSHRGQPLPILVGGAVVEFDTAGQIHSGDFDLVTVAETELREALLAVGFIKEDRRNMKRGGFYHPILPIGVEFVSGGYFEGHADRQRIRVIPFPEGEILMAATEDLIADRLGQWVASGRRDSELLIQAQAMIQVAENVATEYLDRRIRQDTVGELTLAEFLALGPEAHHP